MLFLLHYFPNHWEQKSWDTAPRNHLVLYRAKIHGWPLCCCRTDLALESKHFLMIRFKSPTESQLSSDALRMPTKVMSQNVQSKKSGTIYWELTPLQKRYPLCRYCLLLHPSIVRFDKEVCLQGRCLLKGTGLQIDNCLRRTVSSYYRSAGVLRKHGIWVSCNSVNIFSKL